ncbi:hypothetical protein [Flavobacterium sp. JP2137]|uniref:hypothetical protein n=1 Tax=Flavobacterium sp. JP2137 TaxID=3414510 RepID=UPI003D2FAD6B
MKKLILTALMALPILAFAQEKPKLEKKTTEPRKTKDRIAYILNDQMVSKAELDQLTPEQIKRINIVKEPFVKDGIEYLGQIQMESVD